MTVLPTSSWSRAATLTLGLLLIIFATYLLSDLHGHDKAPLRTFSLPEQSLDARLEQGFALLNERPAVAASWPKNIVQTLPDYHRPNTSSTWAIMNPDWNIITANETMGFAFVDEHFGHMKDVVDFWWHAPLGVIRSDFLRLLVMFVTGGVYADSDVDCLQPISEWLTKEQWEDTNLEAVVGIEIDELLNPNPPNWGWSLYYEFAQYVFMLKPQSRVAEIGIKAAIHNMHALMQEQQVSQFAQIEWTQNKIAEIAGPAPFTKAALQVMEEETGLQEIKHRWALFSRKATSVQVGSTLVLPVDAFGTGQVHSGSNPDGSGDALVKHHFQSSWVHSTYDRRRKHKRRNS